MKNVPKATHVSLAKSVLKGIASCPNVQVPFIVQKALNVQLASARNKTKAALILLIVPMMKCVMESYVSRDIVQMMIVL